MSTDDLVTLYDAITLVAEKRDEGVHCPCCTQYVRVYERKINSSMARDLIALYRRPDGVYVGVKDLQGREVSQLAWWGLVEEEKVLRPDGGRRGHWRITDKGRDFVEHKITVPHKARVFDSKLLGLTGPDTSIREALGDDFNYDELMGRLF